MAKPVVIVEHLWKRYHKRFGASTLWSFFGRRERTDDEFWALKDVSFEVQPGECLGIIGPNGSGKSTLLKILSKITAPTRGRTEVKGRVASMLEVGTGFHPDLTGRENVFLSAAILGMSRSEIRRRFDEIVAFSGVEDFIDVPVKRYSSGMYVRLAFAVAAHIQTNVLIVDEVLAVGDVEFQKKCLGSMERTQRGDRTILFVTHNMAAIRGMCDRVLVLAHGQQTALDVPEVGIPRYLGGESLPAERRWRREDAPGHARFRVLGVRVLSADGKPQPVFDIDAPLCVEMDFSVCERSAFVGQTVSLAVDDGTVVFSSLNPARQLGNGDYRSRCTIPAHLLNERVFRVSVALWAEAFRDAVHVPEAVEFSTAQKQRPAGFYGTWAGVVRPSLHWDTAPLSGATRP